jgi:hypothetical protein
MYSQFKRLMKMEKTIISATLPRYSCHGKVLVCNYIYDTFGPPYMGKIKYAASHVIFNVMNINNALYIK